jgi:hypothetical protein
MNGISSLQVSTSIQPLQKTESVNNMRFENALATARAIEDNSAQSTPGQSRKSGEAPLNLPAANNPLPFPQTKMVQSLHNLIQYRSVESFGSLDIRQ